MNKKLLPLISILISISYQMYCQDLMKVVDPFAFGINQEYYVLESNKNVKHGSYLMISNGDTIVFGEYDNNRMAGIWKYFDYHQEIELIYNHDNGRVIDWNCQEKNQRCRESGSPAYYSLGLFAATAEIGSNIKYPEKAALEGRTGSPIVYLIIDEKGSIEKTYIGKSSNHLDIDKAAINAVNSSFDKKWIPAVDKNGDSVKDTLFFKLNFVM